MSSKIKRDLQELVQAQVISSEVSQNISKYYDSKAMGGTNRLFAIFGVLGSLLIGLGIILILAHNWDDFSRTTKTIWAFIPLVVGQLFSAYALFKKRSVAWKETAATFLFFAIGSSISLVSQIYNIPGSMPSFLLIWIVLAAPLIYLLRSHAAAILFLIFATAYACNYGYFNDKTPWLYLLLLLWLAPFYYKQLTASSGANLTGIYNWFFPLSIIISLGAFIQGTDSLGFIMYMAMFCLLYNLGKLSIFGREKMRANGYLLLGSVGTIFVLIMASFNWIWEFSDRHIFSVADLYITLFFGLLAVGVIICLFKKKQVREFNLFQFAFFLFAIIHAVKFEQPEIPMALTNILVLTLGVFAIRIGSRQNRFSILNYGLLIIAVLIACRFFDTEISFVIRGLLFVMIGIGFFIANYLMYRKQQKIKSHE